MSMVINHYNSEKFRNIFVFTGPRLSDVTVSALPSIVEIVPLVIDHDKNLKKRIKRICFEEPIQNLFVFTAYRFLETYVLKTISTHTQRHLIQDGANFYFNIKKTVLADRLRQTLRIYRDLWCNGFVFLKPVLYKKHLAQCSFIDNVWVTNPEIYRQPRVSRKPIFKIEVLNTAKDLEVMVPFFREFEKRRYTNQLIYLTARLTSSKAIQLEIDLIKKVAATFPSLNLMIKLHPYSTQFQIDQVRSEFQERVLMNAIPAELYIKSADDSYIIGGVSAAFYCDNPSCRYISLIKIYQQFELFPSQVDVQFPRYVKKPDSLDLF